MRKVWGDSRQRRQAHIYLLVERIKHPETMQGSATCRYASEKRDMRPNLEVIIVDLLQRILELVWTSQTY